MPADSFTDRIKEVLLRIPQGKAATYGQIALLAGNAGGARQVVRVLHSSSARDKLPWHRVINSRGTISLRPGAGYELQKELLEAEGVEFCDNGLIDLGRFLWSPG
jgi:methylated-DNA-protein-cysteine methyltransferase-like protein